MKFKPVCYRMIGAMWNHRWHLPQTDRGDTITIICLHGVHDQALERLAPPPTSSITATSLEANLRALARHHTVIPLRDAVAMISGRASWRPRCAVLTFDDSLACTANIAVPILQRMNMTASIFLSTEAIETRCPYWWLRLDYAWHHARRDHADVALAERDPIAVERGSLASLRRLKSVLRQTPARARNETVEAVEQQLGARLEDPASQYPYASAMTWAEAKNLAVMGFDIGSHTVTHPNLALLSTEDARQELVLSKATIEHHTGIPCRHFCYPYGSFTESVAALALESGYEAATSTISPGSNRLNQELFALRRYSMPGVPWKLGYILSGFPEFSARFKPGSAAPGQQTAPARSLSGAPEVL